MDINKILDKDISFYTSVKDTNPKTRKLADVLFSGEFRDKVNAVRNGKTEEEKKRLKGKAPCFTVSGVFTGGSDSSLIKHSGLICIDFDLKDNKEVSNFDKLKELISAVPYVAYCGKSISGKSFFAIIPIASPELHREHFTSLQRAFKRCGLTVDASGINVGRKRFVSIDSEPYVNPNAKTYIHYVKNESRVSIRESKEAKAEDINEIIRLSEIASSRGIDITGNYSQWFSIACALANDMGEEGRKVFHAFSRAYIDYDESETDSKYNNALEAVSEKGKDHPRITTVYHYCRRVGLDVIADFDSW